MLLSDCRRRKFSAARLSSFLCQPRHIHPRGDALHTQRDHARFLVEAREVRYAFTVKRNQMNLYDSGRLVPGRATGTEIQTKLRRWANDHPHRRFDDLYNLVCNPAFLATAWERVAGNKGARSAGVDG